MAKSNLMAGVASFAGLLGYPQGVAPATGKRGEDDKDDEEARKARRAEEDNRRKDEDARRAEEDARRAEEDDADAADPDDEDDKKDKGKKAKKSKAAEDDEECDEEDDSEDMSKGRKAERARWVKVLSHPAATGGRIAAACTLLARGRLSGDDIIATLADLPAQASARPGLGERMAAHPTPNPGQTSAGKPSLAAQICEANDIRLGKK